MSVNIQLRRGTAAAWTSANPTLAQGELGLETDTNKVKFGDGVTHWNSLAYYTSGGAARELLTAARTYYVRTDGSNSNNGLANTAGGAFLTIQKAVDVVATIDAGGFAVTIQIADGTYNESIYITPSLFVGMKSGANLILQGNTTTPSNVVINGTNYYCIFALGYGTDVKVDGIKFTNSQASGTALWAHAGAWIRTGKVEFGACTFAHIQADHRGTVETQDNYTISGGAAYHAYATFLGYIIFLGASKTVTLTGTPGFTAFVAAAFQGLIIAIISLTYSGSATGFRYIVNTGSAIYSGAGGASRFPGSVAGTVADGAAYDTTLEPELNALAGLVSAANKIPMFSGAGTATLLDLDTDPALAANSDTKLASQKAVKAYVDGVAQGLSIKGSCRLATAAALPTNTYLAGVLTGTATGVLTVDGQTVNLNDRVLVKNEAAQANNGIYKCTTAGAVGVAYVLTRATDMDTAAEIPGAFSFIEDGTANDGAGFVVADQGPFTLGTTAIIWTQFSGAGEITVGSGLTKSGNQLDRAALTGDVTASAGSNATTIANDAVTYPKMQNVSATDKLLGRATAGAGDVEEIALTAAGRALIDDADAATQRATLLAYPLPWTRGTSWPASPAAGWRCTRTDYNNMDFEFDGTRWLSTEVFVAAFIGGAGVSANSNSMVPTVYPELYDKWIEQAEWSVNVQPGGSALATASPGPEHSWILAIYKYGTGGATTSVLAAAVTLNSGASDGVFRAPIRNTINALIGATYSGFRCIFTKVGSPGALWWHGTISYRVVGP